MTLSVEIGRVFVPAPLDVCVIWLDDDLWMKTPFEQQKNMYLFVERMYKTRCLFYCTRVSASVYKLIYTQAAAVMDAKPSEETLQKVFEKYIQPRIKDKPFDEEIIKVPKLF